MRLSWACCLACLSLSEQHLIPWHVVCTTQVGVTHRLAEGTLGPTDEDIKEHQYQY